jgi:hypothetical protein
MRGWERETKADAGSYKRWRAVGGRRVVRSLVLEVKSK